MIRAAILAVAVAAMPVAAQTSRTPTTKTGPAKAGTAKTAPPKTAPAKTKTAPPTRSTLAGIYTIEEAEAGKELYVPLCASCHLTANIHSGAEFRKKWAGKPLSELYALMRSTMPKNDPGNLAEEDYGVILAYMLQLNKMPAGKAYLSTDTLELRKIRIDTVRSVKKP
jgi:S-disulfanyl-L-cysteine oxidoreductase SoxD